ncbi:YdhK family protein [Corynebacterium sp. HMSC28B08]|uniref:YdhK family protein n=1 Tax=Corynebacterium sp. HMSC28B08 TaxID=1581066 RepID=UPI000A402D66|nr:YdhK family protein [Corynebacterium sp. HMSC28B08]
MNKKIGLTVTAGVLTGTLWLTGCASDADDEKNVGGSATSELTNAQGRAENSGEASGESQGGKQNNDEEGGGSATDAQKGNHSPQQHGTGHHMDHPSDGGPVPAGMKEATDPQFHVGQAVTLKAEHMSDMNGAKATIVGAYKTHTYAVNYTPVGGGDRVMGHKWVVQEELADSGSDRLPNGAAVTITADHMDGMKGAKGTVASSTDETVYVVDYEANGKKMTNHKWVVESEIAATDRQ